MQQSRQEVGDRYILTTGEAGARRLSLLHDVYREEAERLIKSKIALNGANVADIGCGTGLASIWFAEQVGEDGEVTAIDISAEQLQIAKKNAQNLNIKNITFIEASAYDTKLPQGHYDVVYCRVLLCHLAKPLDALKEMAALLKSGGLLICFDIDLVALFSLPYTECYKRISDLILQVGKYRGLDYQLGLRLPSLFRQVGLLKSEMAFIQPVYCTGEKKRLWEYSFLEASPAIIEAGLCSESEVQQLSIELAEIANDETIFVAQSCMPVTWARKP